ncbi:MAG: NAD(P)-dependent alcohol dehydrogenase, partial [Candidatus Thorarchaeota archaeon]
MKAAVYEKFGPPEVVEIRDIEKPTPRSNEVLVRIHATTLSRGDSRMRSLDVPGNMFVRFMARLFLGIRGPRKKILGMQLAGQVEAVGENVTKFKIGDEVFATTYPTGFGGHAEYKCLPEDTVIATKPANMSYEEAATIPIPGMGALNVLKRADIQPGQKVLVYGASGSVGTNAVQLSKYWGAEVTGVCSESNFEMVKSLGADNLIDYKKTDFAQTGETYDVVFDAVGKISPSTSEGALKEDGIFLSITTQGKEETQELIKLRQIIEEGKLISVIDRTYPLEEIVEAHRYVDTGHKKGNVVI